MNDSLSYIARLEKQLQDLEPVIDIMMDNSSIYYYDINADNSGVFFIGANVYHWGDKDEKNKTLNYFSRMHTLIHLKKLKNLIRKY